MDVYKNKRPELTGRNTGGVKMLRKPVSTIFGLCCAVLVLASSPTVKADGHEDGKAKLPEVFKLSNRGEGMSDELVFKLQTVTAVNRLQAAAQTDEELNALKYEDTMAALKAVGVEWSGETQVEISRDEDASEDVVIITRGAGNAVLRYDDGGKQIVKEEAQEMSARGSELDNAAMCCWSGATRQYQSYCYQLRGTCDQGAEVCYSGYFTPSHGFKNYYMACTANYGSN